MPNSNPSRNAKYLHNAPLYQAFSRKTRPLDSTKTQFNEPALGRVVDECVRPALDRTAFKLRILTETQPAGLIDNQLRAALLAARFIISDLTYDSFGAYWEAGFGEGRGIPVIYMCEKGKWTVSKTHFNSNHMGTIVWDEDNLTKAQDNLVATIRATLRAEAKQADD